MAEVARLKRKAEVRLVSIPAIGTRRWAGTFVKETMNNLTDLGEKMGSDPASWSNESPTF